MDELLSSIQLPSDLRKLSVSQLPKLAKELRKFIIDVVAVKQGHLGASLGVIELTIALHYLFDTPYDLLVWDVGHQAYAHKILTGRRTIFHTNRKLNGISGFPKISESIFDTFGVGHSSTSISAALGMAIASSLQGDKKRHHIAVIGDASIASGMAFEALNHAGVSESNLLIVLNDNAIGIDPSVGALKEHFNHLKVNKLAANNNIISALNLDYSGPIDGHDLNGLLKGLGQLKDKKGPRFLHVLTTKGKGLYLAERNQVKYHAPGKFDAKTGKLTIENNKEAPLKYQEVFGKTMVELAKKNAKIVGITPAMLTGSSLKMMAKEFPERTFDVGISEQHAVTFSAGMATQGMIPFCNIYSTFIQRAYDQVIHDVALQKLPVIFCLDRSGLVGEDGATHHGVFDIAFMRAIPNMIVFAPRNELELRNILFTVQLGINQPITIRYPRGKGVLIDWQKPFQEIELGTGVCLQEGTEIAILSLGTVGNNVTKAIEGFPKVAHYDMRFAKPLDEKLLHKICTYFKQIITIEEGTKKGGFGSAILEFASKYRYKGGITTLGIQDDFVEHGTIQELQKKSGIDSHSILEKITSFF